MSTSATATPSAPSRAESFRSATSQNGTPATSTQSTSAGAEQEEIGWTAPAGTLKVPIPRPSATSKPPKPAELSAEQEV
ncbi:hypothetical protein LTR95_015184, partial [Oleoguttula sp. CCFEE 5521]